MQLYRLNITPSEDTGEGEDWDEWFGALIAAKKQRKHYIKEDSDFSFCGENYSIDAVEIPNLPKKKLLLYTLNRKGRFPSKEIVASAKQHSL